MRYTVVREYKSCNTVCNKTLVAVRYSTFQSRLSEESPNAAAVAW